MHSTSSRIGAAAGEDQRRPCRPARRVGSNRTASSDSTVVRSVAVECRLTLDRQ